MKSIDGLKDLVLDFDAFLLDAWGVLHNGVSPFPGVLNALKQLQQEKKQTIIITNSPARKQAVIVDLEKRGISRELYQDVISSGELAFQEMNRMLEQQQLPSQCVFLGQSKHRPILNGLSLECVEQPKENSFLFNTGPNNSWDEEDSYRDLLQAAMTYRIPMICVNPDREVIFQGTRRLCAGGIARSYEQLGGTVLYFGKPYPKIYEIVKRQLPPNIRMIAIGDSLETDIQGAIQANILTVLVLTGVTPVYSPSLRNPTYCMPQLQWESL